MSVHDGPSSRWCFLGSSELSHLILDIAIWHVSRTHRAGSVRNSFRITSEDGSDIAPIASAAWEKEEVYFFGVIWHSRALPHDGPWDLQKCYGGLIRELVVQILISFDRDNMLFHALTKRTHLRTLCKEK